MILPRSFYERETIRVARKLLGCFLVHREEEGTTIGRIVEDEAYVEQDPAAHSFNGMTERNRVMFGQAGHAYVFFVYGKHFCVNAVTGAEGKGEAVLIRALEPVEGIVLMQARRLTDKIADLCSGPGKLTQALHITMQEKSEDLPYRFYLKGNRFVSRK
jgi:DNA-3-methyladenine glycosylase